jgi:hypothetical protein
LITVAISRFTFATSACDKYRIWWLVMVTLQSEGLVISIYYITFPFRLGIAESCN